MTLYAIDRRTFYPKSRPVKGKPRPGEQTWEAHDYKVASGFGGQHPGSCRLCPFSVNDPIHAAKGA